MIEVGAPSKIKFGKKGTSTFTEIAQIALPHSPTYQAALDRGASACAQHVTNFFDHTGVAEQPTVTVDSINREYDASTSTTLVTNLIGGYPRLQQSFAMIRTGAAREVMRYLSRSRCGARRGFRKWSALNEGAFACHLT